ncbi:MAG: ABC transporter permease [Lachnospiraceae bacterium]|nr:ABC transporter permease [Lachnospiraceae bacterium]
MEALWFIIWNNMKKKKRDVVVLFFLIALAALFLYVSVSVFAGLNSTLDAAYERAHTADLIYITSQGGDRIPDIFKSQEEVVEYEASECLFFVSADYWKGKEEESQQSSMFIFGRIEEERTICTLAGSEHVTEREDSILLPYYLKAAGGYAVGDPFYLLIGETEWEFHVAGFVQDPLFATPLNVSAYSCYISNARFNEMQKVNDATREGQDSICYKVRLRTGEDSIVFDHKMSQILVAEIPEIGNSINLGMNWRTMRGGVAILSKISMGVMLVFSLLLIAVALIIVRFSVYNFLEMNRKNTGILQAAGYTTRQLQSAVMLEMAFLAFLASITGILFGILGSGLIGSIQGMMLGLSWNQKFHTGAALVTVAALMIIVTGVAWLCGRAYRKTPVLDALRGGISTHNFKRNPFPFEKSRLPEAFVLAGKHLFGEKGKTVSVLCIVTLLSFSVCMGFGLYENFAIRTDTLLKIVGTEAGDILVTGDGVEQAGEELAQWDGIESVLYYGNTSVHIESADAETEVTCDYWRDPEALHNEMLVQGRLPKYENEIVLTTSIAKRLHVKPGDTVYVTAGGERLSYVVSGIDQKMNNMGLKAMMCEAGAKRLINTVELVQVFCYLEEGVTVAEMSERILVHFPELTVADSAKQVANTMKMIVFVMAAICVVFVLITLFVVVLVEVLLIKSKLIKERRNYGIWKALGFTTAQLIAQTMLMNVPVIAAGAVLGAVCSSFLFSPLVVIVMSFCGIKQVDMSVPPIWMLISIAGIVLVALAASFLSSVRIRKIEPVSMLMEE